MQIPLLQAVDRHNSPIGIKVPQAGLFHDISETNQHHHAKVKNTVIRTHRWQRVLRDQDEIALLNDEFPLLLQKPHGILQLLDLSTQVLIAAGLSG